jgi:NADH-quinone oxidoreductase subunit A
MPAVAAEYLPILLFLAVAVVLSGVFVGLPVLISNLTGSNKPYADKLAEYESGFPAFSDARQQFDVRFYLVSILFIIFDLEVAFLFPWAVSLGETGVFGWASMMVFLGILTVGFIYEWKKGALEWE